MRKIILRADHITFSSAQDISQICKPLSKLNISSFNFVRTYNNGSQINLGNIPTWLSYFYDNEFYNIGAFERHPSKYNSGYALWPQLSGQKIFYDARNYFNIDNGITIIEKKSNYCEFYYFGASCQSRSIINFYLNNLDLLQRFILYFKEKSNDIIKKADKNLIILPNHFEGHVAPDDYEEYCLLDKNRQEFIDATELKIINLSEISDSEKLTIKQLRCLKYIMKGYTAKQIARELNLSFRTIEGHLNKLKTRFDCKTKSALIEKLIDHRLINFNQIY